MKKGNSGYGFLAKDVAKAYPEAPPHRIQAEIRRITEIASQTNALLQMRILDLGCGSERSLDGPGWIMRNIYRLTRNRERLTLFHPWYCRVLEVAGADAVGVDIAPNVGERFESHVVDIMDPHALDGFDDNSFDAVNNYKLTVSRESVLERTGTSPHIFKNVSWAHHREDIHDFQAKGIPYSQWKNAFHEVNQERMHSINDQVSKAVQRILKEGGVYTLAEFVYFKKRGQLVHEKTMKGLGS